jgi:ferric-dicitrate binding protein FerR (iron transport regulator)
MSDHVMNNNEKPAGAAADDRQPSAMHRRQRSKNIALGAVLFGMVVLFYVVAIVKMSGG